MSTLVGTFVDPYNPVVRCHKGNGLGFWEYTWVWGNDMIFPSRMKNMMRGSNMEGTG
jgi:hypothetical protein